MGNKFTNFMKKITIKDFYDIFGDTPSFEDTNDMLRLFYLYFGET